jgi:hypothetical protein
MNRHLNSRVRSRIRTDAKFCIRTIATDAINRVRTIPAIAKFCHRTIAKFCRRTIRRDAINRVSTIPAIVNFNLKYSFF